MNRKHWLVLLAAALLIPLILLAANLLSFRPSAKSPSPTSTNPPSGTLPPSPSSPAKTTGSVPTAAGDDVPMVRVPAGEFIAGSRFEEVMQFEYEFKEWAAAALTAPYSPHFANEVPQRTIRLDEFYIDQYEVTNARFRRCEAAGVCSPPPSDHYHDPAYDDYPVVWVTWQDAETFCQWAGKRLPTELEWEKAARGIDARLWPWGNEWDEDLYDDRQELVTLVGSNPGDTSPYGVMDMAGNATEWVADWYLPYPGSRYNSEDFGRTYKVVRGGDDRLPPILGVGRRAAVRSYAVPDERFDFRGFRCVQGGAAPTPGPTYTPEPTSTPDVSIQDMVLVPAGEFLMGSENGEPDERPEHMVYLDSFYIDRCEASNDEFAAFLNAIGGHIGLCDGHDCAMVREDDPREQQIRIHFTDGKYKVELGFEDNAVESATWYGAQAYCEYYGLRLPTEAEWEKAARGTDGRTWPWGNEWDPSRLARPDGLADPAPVCSNSRGGSPYGALDMAGNAVEWVSDWYSEGYYAVSPSHDPQGPSDERYKSRRGIVSLVEPGYNERTTRRLGAPPEVGNAGFRCAVDASGDGSP